MMKSVVAQSIAKAKPVTEKVWEEGQLFTKCTSIAMLANTLK